MNVRRTSEELIQISYFIENPGKASLGIFDQTGKKIHELVNHNSANQGLYQKIFRTKKLGKGGYVVKLVTGAEVYNKAVPTVIN